MAKYKKLYTACLFLNFFLLPLSTYGLLLSTTSYFWDETEGIIVSADKVKVRVGNSFIEEAIIEFTYSVDNVEYVSDIVSLAPRIQFKNRTFSPEKLKQYDTGKKVKVSYPALYPRYGVLETGVKPNILLMFFISILLMFAGRMFKRKINEIKKET